MQGREKKSQKMRHRTHVGHGMHRLFFWKECGSYTVEAAFIVPIILGLIFVVLYMLFVLHDKAVLQADLDNTIFLLAEGGEIDKEEYAGYLSRALWISGLQDVEIKDGVLTVSGKVTAAANVDIPILSFFMCGKQESSFSESFCKVQPEEILRYGADILRSDDGEEG